MPVDPFPSEHVRRAWGSSSATLTGGLRMNRIRGLDPLATARATAPLAMET
jgi:hypothetical protein